MVIAASLAHYDPGGLSLGLLLSASIRQNAGDTRSVAEGWNCPPPELAIVPLLSLLPVPVSLCLPVNKLR
jgi:hypothetical protein